MLKKIFKRKALIAACALTFSTMYIGNAAAAYPVTNYTLDPYLMGFTTGNGLIETLVSMNDKLAQATITSNENAKNQVMNSANADIQKQRMENGLKRIPSANACAEVTSAGGRGAAGSGTKASKEELSQNSLTALTEAKDALVEAKKNILTRPSIDVCSKGDMSVGRGGCSSEGQYPDKDKSAAVLLSPPVSRDDAAAGIVANESYDAQQLQVAEAAKRNLTVNVPVEQLNDKNLENTTEGRDFLSAFAAFADRSTAGSNAIDSILAIKKSSNVAINSRGANIGSNLTSSKGAETAWKDQVVRDKYKVLFPNAKFPENPSEWEMLRYEIYSRYADTTGNDAWQVKISTATTEESLREIARMMAIQLRMSMIQIQRQEEGNVIGAADLNQGLDPVTKGSLKTLRGNAEKATQASQ